MIVAERTFEVVDDGTPAPTDPRGWVWRPGEAPELRLRVAAPVPDGEDFRCAFTLAWPDREDADYAMGVDSVQALQLALQKAHIDLLTSPEGRRGALRWLGMGDLGLPLPPGMTPETVRGGDG